MTEAFYDMKLADLVLRICNADVAYNYYKDRSMVIEAHNWRKQCERLEAERKELVRAHGRTDVVEIADED